MSIIVAMSPESSSLSVNISSVSDVVSFSFTIGMTPCCNMADMQFFWLRYCCLFLKFSFIVKT